MTSSVLVVDDDPALRRALAQRLEHWGWRVREAASGAEALEAARRAEPDLVLLDLQMPGIPGAEVLRTLREEGIASDVVVLTAHGSVESAVAALQQGAADFLQKPTDFEVLRAVVERCAKGRRRERAASALAERVDGASGAVFGASPRTARALETASRAAVSDATVLLEGESGVGKGVFAETVHRKSPRCDGPFVYVNCVALSDDLAESTLFGHEKGAFTGAVERKAGRLEAAAGGTAFLDEIGDVTPRLQAKLLRFLDTGEYERVGGTRTLSVDCRVIAATNKSLEAEVRAGRFREDLWYRLNVIRIEVPALRERREDVRPLAVAWLARFARDLGRPRLALAARTLELLEAYAWPGNVRQLKNVLERAAVLSPGDLVTPESLPPEVLAPARAEDAPGDWSRMPLRAATVAFRRAHVLRALAAAGGSQTKAAAALGIQRTFLNRLLRGMGMTHSKAAGEGEPGGEAGADPAGRDPRGS